MQQLPSASTDTSNATRLSVLEALALSVRLTARYNGQTLTLAPHALLARHGELYLSALNLTKNWRAEDEQRLGYFKLAGLAGVEVTGEPFEPLANSAAMLSRAGDELLLAVATS